LKDEAAVWQFQFIDPRADVKKTSSQRTAGLEIPEMYDCNRCNADILDSSLSGCHQSGTRHSKQDCKKLGLEEDFAAIELKAGAKSVRQD
jgi:hypothetical protein